MKPHSFRRLVLGLRPSASDRSMHLAVELADLLHLDLLGLLLEDTSLNRLASIPFAREFRPLGGGWHSIDPEQLSHDFELAARNIQRMFTKATKRLATRYQFDIARGSMADAIASISRTDDIVMIVEPNSLDDRVAQQFFWLIQAAFRSAAAVMLVPPQVIRAKGPIVAFAASSDDQSIRVAAAIATAAQEDLIVLDICETAMDSRSIRALAGAFGLTINHVIAGKILGAHPATFLQVFQPFQERLMVATRGVFQNGEALTIAAVRRVPVLVIEPPQADEAPQIPETATTESLPPRSNR